MITVQFYIGTVKLDLFGDESITIIDSIQDTRDIAKVKTSFTKTFNVPASPTNNKVFKYYQNPTVQDSFDARYRTTASIHLDGILFKKGSARLNGVTMKDGNPTSYQVSFLGNTITLPDALEDDTLDKLDFSTYTHDYDEATVRTGLQTSLSSGVIRYPLIYHTTRYFYTTVFEDGTGAKLDYTQLKPAIQLKAITDQIETQYDSITWASSIHWDDTDFAKLYMWCHRDEGDVIGGDELQQVEVPYSEWSYGGTVTDVTPIITDETGGPLPTEIIFTTYAAVYNIVPNDSSLYNVYIIDELTGDTRATYLNVSGTANYGANFGSGSPRTWEPKLVVTTEGGIASFTTTLQITKTVDDRANPPAVDTVGNYTTTTATFTVLSEIVISSQIPQMRIIDFLTSLFKMNNLTAWLNSADEIVVEPLDDYYARAVVRDITKYILTDNHTVKRTVPFSQIEYSFAPASTKLLLEWNRANGENESDDGKNREFGNLEYTDVDQKYDGSTYSVNVGFEKMLFEAQFDSSDVQTDLTSGWFVNKKDEPVVGAPLVMYIENTSCSSEQIRWIGASNSTTYNRPSNSSSTNTINFNAEIDEHTLAVKTTSLFNQYHSSYISNVFNRYSRIYTFKALLPLSFILNYELYDTIVVSGISYRINRIRINLTNGLSTLDLINIV